MIGGYASTLLRPTERLLHAHFALHVNSPAMHEPLMTLPALIHSAGFAFGLLLTALLLSNKKGNRAANLWLAAYVMCLTSQWFESVLEETRAILEWPAIAHLTDWLVFLIGPCLWMYVRRLTGHSTPSFLRWLPHTFLGLLCLALLAKNFYFQPVDVKIALMKADYVSLEKELNEGLLIAAAQVMCYWIASLLVLRRFNASLRERYSSIGKRSFGWLRVMLFITLIVWISWVIGLLLLAPWSDIFTAVSVPALYLLAYFGFRQSTVFSAQEESEAVATTTSAASTRYARSGLDRERVPEFLSRLDSLMQTEKPWLESDLTLADLAARAGLSPHNLSQLLNEELGKSFFDYINGLRVEEVKRCLLDPAYDSQTILDIALAAGFSSKTAFNTAFRQHTSMTPSEFRRQARSQPGMQSA
jgi:AraC-like DNA-binding protein